MREHVGLLSRRRKRAVVSKLAAAYAQEINTTPEQERELASGYPGAWASGEEKARGFFEGGDQEKIVASDGHQLFSMADMHLTEPPGTPEARAFMVSFVRAIESLVHSDHFRASELRTGADQLSELHQMKQRAPKDVGGGRELG